MTSGFLFPVPASFFALSWAITVLIDGTVPPLEPSAAGDEETVAGAAGAAAGGVGAAAGVGAVVAGVAGLAAGTAAVASAVAAGVAGFAGAAAAAWGTGVEGAALAGVDSAGFGAAGGGAFAAFAFAAASRSLSFFLLTTSSEYSREVTEGESIGTVASFCAIDGDLVFAPL